jgi:hypothetical protein
LQNEGCREEPWILIEIEVKKNGLKCKRGKNVQIENPRGREMNRRCCEIKYNVVVGIGEMCAKEKNRWWKSLQNEGLEGGAVDID